MPCGRPGNSNWLAFGFLRYCGLVYQRRCCIVSRDWLLPRELSRGGMLSLAAPRARITIDTKLLVRHVSKMVLRYFQLSGADWVLDDCLSVVRKTNEPLRDLLR